MSAGTISIQNNTAAVAGDGTAFTTALSAGDFIVITAGGVTYTLPVKSIESDTALTLARSYNGPAVTAGAWTAMPRDTLNRISGQMAADTSYAIRQRVLEIDNWYQLLEVNGDVTIKMADGSSYTGPSWLKLIDVMKTLKIDELIPLAEQIHADAQQVADDKPVIIQAKDDAQAAAAAAAASENNAAESETNSAASEEVAIQKAKEAKESAEQAGASNPLLALQKSLNLSDLADRAAAWLNVRPIGATPLAADAVNDYDAPTWRQVRNLIESGTAGPTMNGVMNYHIGEAVVWETRAYYPPNCLPRDGQLVNRADWPELWAWAQKTTPITDAAWLADVTKRGSYSNGNGTTTFRVPDWNGVQPGSIPGVFFRGGTGAADMVTRDSGLPNLSGFFGLHVFSAVAALYEAYPFPADSPFFASRSSNTFYGLGDLSVQTNTGANYPVEFGFNAGRQWSGFGRVSGEVAPRQVSGVWLVRASGGFVAANTSWSVIDGDATAPADNTIVRGGSVKSEYWATGASKYTAEIIAQAQYGAAVSVAVIRATNKVNNATADFVFETTGNMTVPNSVVSKQVVCSALGANAALVKKPSSASPDSTNAIYYVGSPYHTVLCYNTTVPGAYYSHAWRMNYDNDPNKNIWWELRSSGQTSSPQGILAVQGSDVRIKYDFVPPKSGAWERVAGIGICEFKYNGQEIQQRGFIAQQMGEIDPTYVFEGGAGGDDDGDKFEILNVNDRAVMADMITVIQALQQKVTDLEKMMADMKASGT
ncbi:tail fiber domain-containing protein [Kluyvera genomosp. 1]|uniref:tail fiber domain-containing protein n=1 Tax=Kluyvera genomosp. 1 TaxID=2774053 RepID=UPI00068968C1|nr:tail fiber domain-containing protein [Kluyvera genomosp. 1]